MHIKGTQFADSEKGYGSTSTQWKVSTTIAYFRWSLDDSPLLNISTFRITIPLATYLCLSSDKQREEAPEKKKTGNIGIHFRTQDLFTTWNKKWIKVIFCVLHPFSTISVVASRQEQTPIQDFPPSHCSCNLSKELLGFFQWYRRKSTLPRAVS